MSDIFEAPQVDFTTQQLADALPNGRAWGNKNVPDSNMRKLLSSVAIPYHKVEQLIQEVNDQFQIRQTYDLIDEWEKSVGIPDECLWDTNTIAKRRQAVIDRLRKVPLVTLEDIQTFIDNLFLDVSITLSLGADFYTFEYDFEVPFIGEINEKFILIVSVDIGQDTFEYDFEVPFIGGPDLDKLRCILEKIVPAEVYIIIKESV